MSHLKNQVAVITGGSSGIGLAVAVALLREGMRIVIAARDSKRLKKASDHLKTLGGIVLALPTDVSVEEQVEALHRQTVDRFEKVDLLVNNAGIGQWGEIEKTTEADWDQIQAINLKGAFLCTKAFLPLMKKQRSGYIVNISSLAGKTGMAGSSAYSASKFGMVGLTQSLLEEVVEHNIRATVVCPGYVATPMVRGSSVPAREMIPPEDIGQLIVGLLHLSPVTVIREIVVERRGAIVS
jgi:3-oxoacyl-[acyl-carrier protein] reductase